MTVTLWTEGFADLSDSVLEAAFRKTLKTAKYWPIKVSDVREHISRAVENETDRTTEEAWEMVLDIRRRLWNPDTPAPFDRAMSRLTERVKYAARASGVFRDFTASEWESGALHTWGKKRFFESFQRWGDSKQDEYLLPEGEVKKLLIEYADAMTPEKRLPAPKQETPEERLRIADELAKAAREVIATYKPKECIVTVSDGDREALRKQAARVREMFPNSKTTDPTLLKFIPH